MALYNFPDHKRGDTFTGRDFKMSLNAMPMNLLGAAVKMQLRKTATATVVLEWNTADGSIVITGVSNDTIHLNEKSGTQMNIEPFAYLYDMQITLVNGEVHTYIQGKFTVSNDISR